MSGIAAKWQKKYRERALQSGMYKLQTWLTPAISTQLEYICAREEITKREAVQRAIQHLYLQKKSGMAKPNTSQPGSPGRKCG